MPLPPAPRLEVSDPDRKELQLLSRQRSIPRGTLLRVNIVLGAAEGRANHLLARELSTTVTTVLLWRKRYEAEGLAGLFSDRPRSGRPKQICAFRSSGALIPLGVGQQHRSVCLGALELRISQLQNDMALSEKMPHP